MDPIVSKYGQILRDIMITLNALADDAYRESKVIDNTVDRFLEAWVQVQVIVTAGAPAGDKNCLIYAYGSTAGGLPNSGGATGLDASYGGIAGQLISNCPLLGIVSLDANNELFTSDIFSVSSAFGGSMPEEWGIIVMNQSGRALGSSKSKAWYQGISVQSK